MELNLCRIEHRRRLRLASAGLPQKQLREALHTCICDCCGALVLGTRFKCIECSDFDLCAGCLRSGAPPQRASPESSHCDNHALAVLRRITDKGQVARAFHFAQAMCKPPTCEEAAPTVATFAGLCERGCQRQEAGVVAICSRCGSPACSACFLCCPGAPALRFPVRSQEEAKMLLGRARAVVQRLPAEDFRKELGPVQFGPHLPVSPVSQETQSGCKIRTMSRLDMEAVLSVESICFMEPYSRETFEELLRLGSSRSLVALLDGSFAGYLILDAGLLLKNLN